jgi:hypothetical protein
LKFAVSQEKLAGEDCSSATSKKFCRGERIDRRIFVKLCEKLGLNWEGIAGIASQSAAQDTTIETSLELVQRLRDRITPHLQRRCGTMRVLDMSHPIGLDDIYTSVNILEKITGRRRLELSEPLRNVSAEEVERCSLGAVREARVPGLEAVEKYSKLMILGKPGAGKTTFLKHLAIQCIGEKVQPHRVPVFITLKEFAEFKKRPDLLEYICLYLESKDLEAIRELLDRGNALILLDGLDEVCETDVSRVLRQIQQFSERYHRNQFVVTCRISARDYIFEQFTEVEIADFDDTQIADFSGKWFRSGEDATKAKRFLQKLKDYPPIRALATSPLLLVLLCLVFDDSGDFPVQKWKLYRDAFNILLKRWDQKRWDAILDRTREPIYKKLSQKAREALFKHVAYQSFKKSYYFFNADYLERLVKNFLENLNCFKSDTENLDIEEFVSSIEAQNGIFVKRAQGYYSFSHLTFHEYFAACQVVEKSCSSLVNNSIFTEFATHVVDKRWREVFLLVSEMLPEADTLVKTMKREIDNLVTKTPKINLLLNQSYQKYPSAEALFQEPELEFPSLADAQDWLPKIRAICFEVAVEYAHDIASIFFLTYSERPIDLYAALRFAADRFWHKSYELAVVLESGINNTPMNQLTAVAKLPLAGELDKILQPVKHPFMTIEVEYMGAGYNGLEQLKHLIKWWSSNGADWNKKLRSFVTKHKPIFQELEFSDLDLLALRNYYNANVILSECLNSNGKISSRVKFGVKSALLLPIAEIQKRHND